MRLLFGLVLIVGVGLAGWAVMMAKDRFDQYRVALVRQQQALAEVGDVAQVYVVNRQIRHGEQITMEDVELIRWPASAIPEGSFTKEEELFPEGETVLRSAMRVLEKHEPVMAVKVTEPGQDAGVSSRLSPGMRAFAINVDVSSGVSGFLRPGDRVDVYWSGSVNDTEVTKLIESTMKLIAVDQSADMDNTNPTIARTVTVEASPAEVAGLALAQRTGRLSLALVGASDDTVIGSVEINQQDLLGIEQVVVEEVEAPRECSIRTRRGAEVVEIPIPCTN